jgi:myosin heavy subunit
MVNSTDEVNKIVEVRYISTTRPVEKVKFEKTVPFINDNTINVNDMASIEDINEVDLLNNLKNRFHSKEIFTNVGPTLIITNPYQKIEKAFGEEVIEEYIKVIYTLNF